MDVRVEVPRELLLDLIELAERAADELRDVGAPAPLPDALRGATKNVRVACFTPALV